MKILSWLIRFVVFFALLMLALNNQQLVTINGLSGMSWSLPMAWLLLATLVLGAALGAASMLPKLIQQRRRAHAAQVAMTPTIKQAPRDELGI